MSGYGKKVNICIVVLFSMFYFWLAAQIPYTHDDWSWGISRGLHHLIYANENGRYAGNFFMVLMTRSQFIKSLVLGSCFSLLPLFCAKLYSGNYKSCSNDIYVFLFSYLLSNIFILSINRSIWQQTYGWVAGFANFVLSGAFFMIWLREINKAFDKEISYINSIAECAIYFILSVICQLFIENIAIYCVLLSFIIIGIYYIRARKIPVRTLLMGLGAVIGLAISFGSSVYDSLWSTGTAINGYRQLTFLVPGSIFTKIKSVCWHFIFLTPRIFGENIVLCVCICIIMSAMLLLNNRHKQKSVNLFYIFLNILSALFFIIFFGDNRIQDIPNVKIQLLNFIFSISWFISVALQIYIIFRNNKLLLFRNLILWISIPAIISPLAFTTEIGARLFFTCALLYIVFICALLPNLLGNLDVKYLKYILCAALCVCCILFIFHGSIYSSIGVCKRESEQIIAEGIQNGAATIHLPSFPHSDYLWHPIPENDDWWGGYKDFYGIDRSVEVIIE